MQSQIYWISHILACMLSAYMAWMTSNSLSSSFPFVHFLSPASVSRHLAHPTTACSSTTPARSPPPHFPPVWNRRVWPLNSKAEPVLPPTLQVTFLNGGNVRPDACCSYTPIFPRMFLGYVHVTMRPKRPDPHPPTQRLDDNQVEHWLCAENFNPWPFDWG